MTRETGNGPVFVRSPVSGTPILCNWDDCVLYGDNRHQIVLREGLKQVIMIFCSERHRQLHLHSTVQYGQLPAGFKRTM